ncbi:MAG TPA: NUDIX domain-containing protein [Gaiellaceae bacterium]|nr:NUDIX domain-containing protein [Gaiellaceae bacterium]
MAESTTPPAPSADAPAHVALATVFQVRDGALCVLLWERAREPFSGAWALPGGTLVADESLEASISRHLAAKVDVREVSHLEQLGTWSDPVRHPERWELATAYLGLVPLGLDPRVPADTTWHSVDALPQTAFDHGTIVLAGRDRLRGKLSYSNIGFALAPETFTLAELRDIYEAALGYEVSSTNLKRVLVRRGAIEAVGKRRAHGPAGGRPAELYRFRDRKLAVTDPFAVLRPPA